MNRAMTVLFAFVFAGAVCWPGVKHVGAQATGQPRFRSSVDLVLVNVVVRDRNGAIVRGLSREDFTVVEDGRPQAISTFGFEQLDSERPTVLPGSIPTVLGKLTRPAAGATPATSSIPEPGPNLSGRRLIILFFDMSSMQSEELQRAFDSAREYISKQLTPVDAMAIVTLTTSLQVAQDFTSDSESLVSAIDRLSGVEGMGFEETPLDPEAEVETGFSADDSEFAVFNTDRRLEALKAIAQAMAGVEQKKSLVYFSSGMTQTGLDNRVAIRSVIDRAVRGNMSIYAADMRGLQAMVPGGDATRASTRGTSAFSGRSVSQRFDQMAASQDALSTLAEDTGGRAFFDQNEFGQVFDRVIADTSAYYILGYTSTNQAKNGRFRRIRIQVRRPDVKLEYRAGYYAPRDFAHSGRDDRELQLAEQMMSDLSVTDLPLYAAAAYFRLKPDRYFVPVWLVVPGSRIPFLRSGSKEKATLDILAVLRDQQERPVGRIRDTVDLSVASSEGVQRKNVQYQTAFELPPGAYRLKVVVRENSGGTLGSFETLIVVPNLAQDSLKVSSVVLGTDLQPSRQKAGRNPLVQDGRQLLANVARVVSPGQQMYFYYEMYDPAVASAKPGTPQPRGPDEVRVLSNLVFFRGRTRVYETPLVESTALNVPGRKAAAFRLEVPVSSLEPGLYTCQVNVVDDVGGAFAFPRLTLYVRPAR